MGQFDEEDMIECYNSTMEAYGEDFDSRMAEVCIEIMLLRYRLNTYGNFHAALAIIKDCDGSTKGRQTAVEVKSAMRWLAYSALDMDNELKNLKKVICK